MSCLSALPHANKFEIIDPATKFPLAWHFIIKNTGPTTYPCKIDSVAFHKAIGTGLVCHGRTIVLTLFPSCAAEQPCTYW